MMARRDGRSNGEIRPVKITRGFMRYAEGSVLIEVGHTKVVCTASIEDRVPPFLKGQGKGWVTAEYGMLPRSTGERTPRESAKGRSGRTYEIQRLIGRAHRAVVELGDLGERTIWLDCDVIQADGGTRTAAITGSFVALVDALATIFPDGGEGGGGRLPVTDFIAATSVGMVDGELLLDLSFEEDSSASVDMNVVMTGRGRIVEVQGTAEGAPFSKADLDKMMRLAKSGIDQLIAVQKQVLGERAARVGR